jgi:hypothetical protein
LISSGNHILISPVPAFAALETAFLPGDSDESGKRRIDLLRNEQTSEL